MPLPNKRAATASRASPLFSIRSAIRLPTPCGSIAVPEERRGNRMAEPGRAPGRTQGYAGTWPPRDAARAGGIAPSGAHAWPSLLAKLREWARAEAGAGRLLPWVPVAFGTGIGFYFAAD